MVPTPAGFLLLLLVAGGAPVDGGGTEFDQGKSASATKQQFFVDPATVKVMHDRRAPFPSSAASIDLAAQRGECERSQVWAWNDDRKLSDVRVHFGDLQTVSDPRETLPKTLYNGRRHRKISSVFLIFSHFLKIPSKSYHFPTKFPVRRPKRSRVFLSPIHRRRVALVIFIGTPLSVLSHKCHCTAPVTGGL